MRILFILKGLPLLRHFEDVFARLAAEGHHIVFAETKEQLREALPASLSQYPNCTVVQAPRKRDDHLERLALLVRRARDYSRYHERVFWSADENRRRALEWLVHAVPKQTRQPTRDGADFLVRLNEVEAATLRAIFEDIERLMPSNRAFERFIQSHQPDLVLVTPLVSLGGKQVEFVKAARALGIPSGLLVFSWDNLSNKGVMHVRPDRVFVWNEIQRREAIDLHGVNPAAVVVTGAPRFDAFYRMAPSLDRQTFCCGYSLDPRQALIVYLGSSPAVSPNEPLFAERWVAAIREAANAGVRHAQILIRPHPRHKEVWKDHSCFGQAWKGGLQPYPGVAVMVAKSVNADQGLFDALYHAGATAALNTSAELEAGILGKPVYTVRTQDIAPGQTGSLHFHYLLSSQGGFVEVADSLEEHVVQLGRGLNGEVDRERQRRFVCEFVRPRGEDLPASPILADEIRSMVPR